MIKILLEISLDMRTPIAIPQSPSKLGWLKSRALKLLLGFVCSFAFSPNSSAQFGQNKVQYQNFNWKFISSAHFDVYFNDGEKYLAEFCAHKAEEGFVTISRDLNYTINKRISIVVYGSHVEYQQTNVIPDFMPEGIRGVTELYKNRVVVNFEGNWELFRQLIQHELTHAILNEVLYYGNTRYLYQSRVQMPLWMNEGLAEFESLHGLDAPTDMFMRDIALSEYLPPLEQLSGFFAYRGGQAFWDYVVRKYGRGKIAEIIGNIRLGMDLNWVCMASFSMSLEEFSERWQEDMKREYFPDLEKFQRLEDFAKRLSNSAKDASQYNSSPAISPDGSKVAFISMRDGSYGIYLMDIEKKSDVRKLISSQRTLDFEELNVWTPGISWNPTGDKIAISAKAGGEDALFIVDAKNGDYKKFTFGMKAISSVAWSPDGKSIAMSATVDGQNDIYLYTISTTSFVKLTNDVFSDAHPTWAPDSKSLYFVSDRGEQTTGNYRRDSFKIWRHDISQSDIYRLQVDDRSISRVTKDPLHKKSSLCVARDGERLMYVADNNGIGNVYLFTLSTSTARPITNSLSGIGQIALSRDDSRLLFSAQIRGTLELFYIKHPLDKSLDSNGLPPTRLKQRKQSQQKFTDAVVSKAQDIDIKPKSFVGYGNVDIDTRRQVVDGLADTVGSSNTSSNMRQQDTVPDQFDTHDYKVSFSNDLVAGGIGYNSLWNNGQGNIQIAFSDVLGNHVLYANVQLWSDLKNSNIDFTYLYQPDILDYTATAYHKAFLSYFSDPRYGLDLYSLRTYGLNLGAYYAYTRFERFEFSLGWIGVSKSNETTPEFSWTNVNENFLVPEFKYVYDNSQWGFFAPYRGMRAFVDLKLSPLSKRFAMLSADFRQYIPIWREYYGVALRAAAGGSFGPDPRNYFLGGVQNWIGRGNFGFGYDLFKNAEDFAFLQLETPLRGFELGQVAGQKYFLANAEFRFPFFSGFVAVPLPFVLLGAVFVDVGTAWNSSLSQIALRRPIDTLDSWGPRLYYQPASLLVSTGLGLRSVLMGYPLKVDIAWRRDGDRWSEPNYVVSLGFDL